MPSRQPAGRRRYWKPGESRRKQRRAHVWIRSEDDCWSGCGLLEHQGRGAEAQGPGYRGSASRARAAGSRYRGRLDDRGLGHGVERDLEAVHRSRDQGQERGDGRERPLGHREEDLAAFDERPGTGRDDPEGSGATHPFDLGDVNLDYQILSEDAGNPQMDVLLVAVKKDKILNYTNVLSMAGRTPA